MALSKRFNVLNASCFIKHRHRTLPTLGLGLGLGFGLELGLGLGLGCEVYSKVIPNYEKHVMTYEIVDIAEV